MGPSYRHKSPSNWRPISLGMGRRSCGGARAPGGGGRAGKGCFPRLAPPAAPRVAPELLWRRPAPRAAVAQCRPHLGSPAGRGEAGALLSPRSELQTPAELGSSHQNLGDAAGNLSRGSGADKGEPSGFRGSLGVPPPFRIHPLPLYSCSEYSLSVYCRRRGCSGEHGLCLHGAYSRVVETV